MAPRDLDDSIVAALLTEVRMSREHFDQSTDLFRSAAAEIGVLREHVTRLTVAIEGKGGVTADVVRLEERMEAIEKRCDGVQADKKIWGLETHRERAQRGYTWFGVVATIAAALITCAWELFKRYVLGNVAVGK